MGGWMTYTRMRDRNGLRDRLAGYEVSALHGDMNRMERDYLAPVYPEPPFATRWPDSDPSAVCAAETGVPVETVRKVLTQVFGSARQDSNLHPLG